MPAIMFDTLKLSNALKTSFISEQAETLAAAIAGTAQDNIATKGDLTELKIGLVEWIVAAMAFNFIGTAGLIIPLVKGLK